MFSILGRRELLLPLREKLVRLAREGAYGWLVAFQLWFLSRQAFAQLDILALIRSADFSIAPKRASHFGQLIAEGKELREAYVRRLLDAFDGKLSWTLSGSLLTYLMSIAPKNELIKRISRIRKWLNDDAHHSISDARTKFLSFVLDLPISVSDLLDVATDTVKWLKSHDEDTRVRTQYLIFVSELPDECSSLRYDAANQTAAWLEDHDENSDVRQQFLSFIERFSREFKGKIKFIIQQTTAWLEQHDENTNVRKQFLLFVLRVPAKYSNVRLEAARQTAAWLERHDEDISVRAQYLKFLSEFRESSEMIQDAVVKTSLWLERHEDDSYVRSGYLAFVRQLPVELSDLRTRIARDTANWLNKNSKDINVRAQYQSFLATVSYNRFGTDGRMPVYEWQQLASDSLKFAALMIRSRWSIRDHILVASNRRLHLVLYGSLRQYESEPVWDVLKISHDVAAEWCAKNPSSRLQLNLPY
jgi:hypothetical protein